MQILKGVISLAQGSVITRVYTSDAYVPLRDVPVVYTHTEKDGTSALLAVLTTDSSGLTKPFYVQTPDSSQSLTPGSVLQPYATLDIHVSAPGYRSVTAEGVQLFPGIQTVQGFQLQPVLPEDQGSSATVPQSTQNL